MAVIIDHGMREMMEEQQDEFYYVTVMNENYAQPSHAGGRSTDGHRQRPLPAVDGGRPRTARAALCGSSARARSCAK